MDLSGYEEPMLTEKDFYQKFEQGDFDETAEIKKAENPYEAYCSWYFDEVPRWYKYILIDLKNDKVSVLWRRPKTVTVKCTPFFRLFLSAAYMKTM